MDLVLVSGSSTQPRCDFDGWYEDDIMDTLKRGETVDVNEVQDEVKSVICEYLKLGGAKI